jgi:NTP pyrophosphatase (non-canonical NTP hydrolase)
MSETSTSVRGLQAEIAAWADQLNPDRQPIGVIAKLLEEIAELLASDLANPMELADVAILLLDLFHLAEIDMGEAVLSKMAINRQRSWIIKPDGRMQHVD